VTPNPEQHFDVRTMSDSQWFQFLRAGVALGPIGIPIHVVDSPQPGERKAPLLRHPKDAPPVPKLDPKVVAERRPLGIDAVGNDLQKPAGWFEKLVWGIAHVYQTGSSAGR
jgi:hypothetical protein